MSTKFAPPPTYTDPVLYDERTHKQQFNPIWLKWFLDVAEYISASGGGSGGSASHLLLQDLQGGGTGEYYHFASGIYNALIAGFTGTGVLVRTTAPTIVRGTFTGAPTYSITTKSADYTLTNTDYRVLVSGTTDITLPTAVGCNGREYSVVNIGTNTVTILPNGSEKINGAADYKMTTQWSRITLVSDNVGWVLC